MVRDRSLYPPIRTAKGSLSKVNVSEITMNAIISASEKAGRWQLALAVLVAMPLGSSLDPDGFSNLDWGLLSAPPEFMDFTLFPQTVTVTVVCFFSLLR